MLRYLLPCILAVACSPAWASDLPRIGVVGVHQASLDMSDQGRAISALVAAIEATGRFDALPLGEVATTIAGREAVILEEGLLAEGRQDLATGKSAYNQAASEDAIVALESAIGRLQGAFPATNDAGDLWEAYVTLGSAYLQSDPPDEVAARQAFTQAVALAPAKPLNPALYPPNVIELFGGVQSKATSSGTGVDITVNGDATVWLDGVEHGKAPVSIEGVGPGTHHVLVRGKETQGYVRFELRSPTGVAPNAPGERQAVAVELGPVTLGEAAASAVGRSNQAAALYHALGKRALGLDYILIAGVSDSILELQLLSTASDTFSKPMELPYASDADDEAAQAIPLLLGGIDTGGTFVALAPVPGPIDLSSNIALAELLTAQIAPIPIGGQLPALPGDDDDDNGKGGKKSKLPLVLGLVSGVVVAGAGTGGFLVYQQSRGFEPNQGVAVIQF